jgi:hypothetical protein
MGMGSIFPSLPERDEEVRVSSLTGLGRLATFFQETAPAYRPYPKPTQVDW